MSGVRLLAEEVTQDAFAHAWSRWPRVRDSPSPAGWAYVTAFRLLNRALRRHRRAFMATAPGDSDHSSSTEQRVDVLRALRGLPASQQQAVVLRHLLGFSTAEAAERLGIRETAVRSTLHRGVVSMRRALHDPDRRDL
jgi:RNA polymerase sigma-70 factor (ECF subfamily)